MFGCSALAKDVAYRSIVRPCLEYACVVWNPHTIKDCALLDTVQNRAARWIMKSHWDSETLKWTKSSRDCVLDLKWPTLSTRRIFLTCLFLFNVIHEGVISKLKDHLLPQSNITRNHKLSFHTISSTINSYRYSLLVNGMFLWNKIPSDVLEALQGTLSLCSNGHCIDGYFSCYFCNFCFVFVCMYCYVYSCIC